jgi:hypothetical protein
LAAAAESVAVLDGRLWAGVPDEELVDGVVAIQALQGQLAALEAHMLAEVDDRDLARKQLHWATIGDWFTHVAGVTRREGRRVVAHAHTLVTERPATLAALRAGEVSPAQAGIVCDAVETLPSSPVLRDKGERVLLEEARRLNATDLARTARHLADVVDPDRQERRDEAASAREERAAHLSRFFSVVEDGMGGVWVKGHGGVEDGALVRAALLPLTKPAPAIDPEDIGCETATDPRDHGARMWDALVEIAQHALDTDRVPSSHGARPRVAVNVDFAALLDRFVPGAEAVTDDGLRLSVAAVRRLACDAEIIPVCLGAGGEVLDVGRASRLVTPALWRALVARDKHCTHPGCTRPPVMCHAHHIVHWADGGETSLENLVLVCSEHHRVLHHTLWKVRLNTVDHRPECLPHPSAAPRHPRSSNGSDTDPDASEISRGHRVTEHTS